MNKKKLFILFFFFAISLNLGMNNVLADCSSCSTSNCESCGCILSNDKSMCIYSNYSNDVLSCGNGMVEKIPSVIPKITKTIFLLIQIAVPVVLVIFGMLDLFKGIMASKEDEIKKGQHIFIKRIISAVLVFFVFAIVKFLISLVSDNVKILDCAECFIKGECDTLSNSMNSIGEVANDALDSLDN